MHCAADVKIPAGLLYRIVLKSNCDTPIDVWLVSGHHQHQQKEDEEVAFGNPHAAVPAAHVKHEPDGFAGQTFLLTLKAEETQSNDCTDMAIQ